jgi:hypothetical protein
MTKLWLTTLACAGILLAQDRVTHVVTIKNGDVQAINRTLHGILGGTNISIATESDHLVLSGPKEELATFEEVIKQLDLPPAPEQNVQTTVYMIAASQAPSSAVIPAELEPVVTQLKGLFPYKGYRVLDDFILRSRSGQGAEASGFVPTASSAAAKPIYQARFSRVTVDNTDKGHVMRFNGLRLGMRVPTADGAGKANYVDVGINTDVDVPEGKKVVVGKTGAMDGPDSALIMVISAKVVE